VFEKALNMLNENFVNIENKYSLNGLDLNDIFDDKFPKDVLGFTGKAD
jgi:hypothetical protein